MSSRRRFIQEAAGAAALAGLANPAAALAANLDRSVGKYTGAPLRILLLGGTGFIGPTLVNIGTKRGHQFSMLNRGRREITMYEDDFKKVEALQGDRSTPTAYDALKGKKWDAVIETSGNSVQWTKEAAAALKDSTKYYLYISSTGVFLPYRTANIPEDGPIPMKDDPPPVPPAQQSYGVTKAQSEQVIREAFPNGHINIRPGYIVGPGDYTDRFTYWPVRIHRGGEIMVPGKQTDPVSYIDVRDLAEFMLHTIETGQIGTYNVTGPGRKQTMAEFVYGVAATTSVPLSWTWIDDYEWLKKFEMGKRPTGEPILGFVYSVPWMIPEGDNFGHMQIDNRKAIAAGLKFHTLAETARDTVIWRASGVDVPAAIRETPRYNLRAEKEAEMLAAWKKHKGL